MKFIIQMIFTKRSPKAMLYHFLALHTIGLDGPLYEQSPLQQLELYEQRLLLAIQNRGLKSIDKQININNNAWKGS